MTENQPERPTPDQVKRVLQEALLRNYPNPDRQGCRGAAVLKEMAERDLPHEDPFWENHVSRCSPCYREFLEFRNQVLARQSSSRKTGFAIAALIGAVLVGGSIYLSSREPQPTAPSATGEIGPAEKGQPGGESPVLTAVLNFERESIARSPSGGAPGTAVELQRIPRARLNLAIYLPTGSEPGQYDVQLLKSPQDQTPHTSSTGTAQLENGQTVLHITPDLSSFDPGDYLFAIRRTGGEWRYYRFVIGG
jgi:hypothetical protein